MLVDELIIDHYDGARSALSWQGIYIVVKETYQASTVVEAEFCLLVTDRVCRVRRSVNFDEVSLEAYLSDLTNVAWLDFKYLDFWVRLKKLNFALVQRLC